MLERPASERLGQTRPCSISVVVPCYRSAESLPGLIDRLAGVLSGVATDHEVVLVNDGSPDEGRTWRAIEDLASRHPWVRGVHLMRNYGQHNALLCGLRLARGEVVVTMDDDLQHPPEEIPKLLAKLAEGHDVVYGVPEIEQHGLLRDLASLVTKLALKSSMGVDIARNVSAFRAMRTHLRDAFTKYGGAFVSIDVLLTWATTRFAAVSVQHDPRRLGASGYTFGKLIRHAINMITGFSLLPLQVATLVGLTTSLFGLGVLVYVIGRFLLQGSVVQGFPFLASIIAIFGGAQLLALGIMGEYLGRIHFRSMDRPPYAVRETTRETAPAERVARNSKTEPEERGHAVGG